MSWILVDEPVDAEDLRRIEVTHWSSHPDVEVRSEFILTPSTPREKWGGALGDGDPVALAAFPGRTLYPDRDSSWVWSWRWPEGHHANERLSTSVRLGSHDARFETEVAFDSGCKHDPKSHDDPKSTAAQLVVATSAGPPTTPMIAELRQYPPEHELQANRSELLALGVDQSQLVIMSFFGQPIQGVADTMRKLFGVEVQLAPGIERRMVTFATDRAPLVDAFVLFAHHESLRFELKDGTLFILDATQP